MKTILTLFACVIFSIVTMAQTPAVTITPGTITNTTVQASFAKNATCTSYYILMSTATEMAQWATMFGVPVDSLVRQWGIHCYADTTNTWTAMAPSTEYTIYALPADAGNVFYPMQTELATTLTGGGTGLSTVTVEIFDITSNSARVVVTPNAETAIFYDGLIRKSYADSIGMDSCIAIIKTSPYPLYSTDNWVWSSLEANTTFYAIGIGKNADGVWGDSTVVEFTTLASGLAEMNAADVFSMYPTPCNGKFNIDLNTANTGQMQLFDLNGRMIYSEKISAAHSEINASALNDGCYFIRVVSENGIGSQKLIINK
jgi:hypothetical protein